MFIFFPRLTMNAQGYQNYYCIYVQENDLMLIKLRLCSTDFVFENSFVNNILLLQYYSYVVSYYAY